MDARWTADPEAFGSLQASVREVLEEHPEVEASAQSSGDTPNRTRTGMSRFPAMDRFSRYAAGSSEERTEAVRANLEAWAGRCSKVYLLGPQSGRASA